jgi:hypothetical protein
MTDGGGSEGAVGMARGEEEEEYYVNPSTSRSSDDIRYRNCLRTTNISNTPTFRCQRPVIDLSANVS